tara:strand:+ start:1693 stop:2076 length:384 start_codon:yes stop_codon:yes gene_type:complete
MKVIKESSGSSLSMQKHPVDILEAEYPLMTDEFKRLQRIQYETFCRKQLDYGPGNISVGTQLKTEEDIKLSLTGLWFRMNDKIQRLKTLLMSNRESFVKDEPIEDAYMDVSNYGIMATIVRNNKWGK